MNVEKKMQISLKDVYQMLIGECRYGYGRNNHLMPGCAYDKVKSIVPRMYKVDEEYAVYTLRQICEECISDQIAGNFYDGEDDDLGNRAEAIRFVNWCLDWIAEHDTDKRYDIANPWRPYNYDLFEANLAKDKEPRFNVYEYADDKIGEKLTESPVSKDAVFDVMFGGASKGVYRLEERMVSDDPRDRRRHYVYHLMAPVEKDFYVEHI